MFLKPNRLGSHPVVDNMVAIDSIYPLNIHCAVFIEAPSVPMMTGSAVFTTVESSTTIKVVIITFINVNHL